MEGTFSYFAKQKFLHIKYTHTNAAIMLTYSDDVHAQRNLIKTLENRK